MATTTLRLRSSVLLTLLIAIFVGPAAASAAALGQHHRKPPVPPAEVRVSPEVLQSSAIRMVETVYPPLARAAGVTGSVVVDVTVDESGNVIRAIAESGHPVLREPAVMAARGWRFKPFKLDGGRGIPIRVSGTIKFDFKLDGRSAFVQVPEERIQIRQTVVAGEIADRQLFETGLPGGPCVMDEIMPDEPLYRVTGRIVDDLTGAPVPGATVELYSDCVLPYVRASFRRQLVTGSDGTFIFEGIPARPLNLRAFRDDTIPVFTFRRTTSDTLPRYTPDAETGSITVRLARAAAISGVVRDPDGKPLKQALVTLKRYSTWAGRRSVQDYAVDSTRADGAYRFGRLPPGRYYLVATPAADTRPARGRNGEMIGLAPERLPTPRKNGDDSFLQLAEGQHKTVNVRLHRARLHHITGRIFGAGVWPYEMQAIGPGGSVVDFTKSCHTCGEFAAWLPSGRFRLVSLQSVSQSRYNHVSMALQVGDTDNPGVIFPFANWGSPIGVPVEIDSTASARLHLEFTPIEPIGELPSLWVRWASHPEPTTRSGEMDAGRPKGTAFLVPGTYTIAVGLDPEANLYVQHLAGGGVDLVREPLVLGRDQLPGGIRVTLAEGAIVEGTTGDEGKPVQAWVYAIARQPDATPFRRVLSDRDGRFTFKGLAPIDYLFFATSIELEMDVHDARVIKYWERHARTVNLHAGDRSRIDLQVTPLGAGRPSDFYP